LRRSRFAPIKVRATQRLRLPVRRVVREPSLGAEAAGAVVRRRLMEGVGTFRPVRLRTPVSGSSVLPARARTCTDVTAAYPVKRSLGFEGTPALRRSMPHFAKVDAGVTLRGKNAPEPMVAQLVPLSAKSSETEPERRSARERHRELAVLEPAKPRIPVAAARPRPLKRPSTGTETISERPRPNALNAETKAWRVLVERQNADLDAHRLFHTN